MVISAVMQALNFEFGKFVPFFWHSNFTWNQFPISKIVFLAILEAMNFYFSEIVQSCLAEINQN